MRSSRRRRSSRSAIMVSGSTEPRRRDGRVRHHRTSMSQRRRDRRPSSRPAARSLRSCTMTAQHWFDAGAPWDLVATPDAARVEAGQTPPSPVGRRAVRRASLAVPDRATPWSRARQPGGRGPPSGAPASGERGRGRARRHRRTPLDRRPADDHGLTRPVDRKDCRRRGARRPHRRGPEPDAEQSRRIGSDAGEGRLYPSIRSTAPRRSVRLSASSRRTEDIGHLVTEECGPLVPEVQGKCRCHWPSIAARVESPNASIDCHTPSAGWRVSHGGPAGPA